MERQILIGVNVYTVSHEKHSEMVKLETQYIKKPCKENYDAYQELLDSIEQEHGQKVCTVYKAKIFSRQKMPKK